MMEGPMQHFYNNFRTIEKNNAQWSRQAHLFVGFCQIYTHSIQTHIHTQQMMKYQNKWLKATTTTTITSIVSTVRERERVLKTTNQHMFVYTLADCLSIVYLLCPFLFHFAFMLVNERTSARRNTIMIAQSDGNDFKRPSFDISAAYSIRLDATAIF